MPSLAFFVGGAFLIFGLFFFLIVGLIVWSVIHHFKRKEAFEKESARLGLWYDPGGSEKLQDTNRDMQPFSSRGGSPRCRNVVGGVYRGHHVRCLEYIYTVSSGKSSHDVHHAVAMVFVNHRWPDVTIQPEHFGHKVLAAFGAEEIDFESDEFSKRFWVRANNRRFAYDLIHARTMEYLLGSDWKRWHVRGNRVVAWNTGRLRPKMVQHRLDALIDFLNLIPRHIVSNKEYEVAPREAIHAVRDERPTFRRATS